MALAVADRGSNKNELIDTAAELLANSSHRREVFKALYTGKRKIKSISELMAATELPRTRVLDAVAELVAHDICERVKLDGETGCEKIPFFQKQRDRILRLAVNPDARRKIPTKRRPELPSTRGVRVSVDVRIPRSRLRARLITVDDIASFSKVRKISKPQPYTRISESTFKKGIAAILGERGAPKDWGGELRDLMSTRLEIKSGTRVPAAFAFKGPGKSGRLTPGKMGKNGDQIQRLVKCPARVFLVQYWRDIDDSVLEQLKNLVQLKSYLEDEPLWYGVIDGSDSTRLLQAYPSKFGLP